MSSSFAMRCPKCGSANYSISRDPHAYSMPEEFRLIFSCACGKQLFGMQVVEEHNRQERAHNAARSGAAATPPVETPMVSVKATPAPRTTAAAVPQAGVESCAWHECEKPRRPRSKYCSRACSNKNARHRFKQRKNAGEKSDREAA